MSEIVTTMLKAAICAAASYYAGKAFDAATRKSTK